MAKPTRLTQEMIDAYIAQGIWDRRSIADILKENAERWPDREAVGQMAFPAAVTLEVGQTIRLSLAGADPDTSKRTIQWSSSDPQVAMVSRAGVVLALAEGTVIITADCGDYCLETKVTVIPAKAG